MREGRKNNWKLAPPYTRSWKVLIYHAKIQARLLGIHPSRTPLWKEMFNFYEDEKGQWRGRVSTLVRRIRRAR